MSTTTGEARSTDDVAEQVFAAGLGAMLTLSIHLGDRLGWYAALRDAPATSTELAERTDTDERYAREWLELQAVNGLLEVGDRPDGTGSERVFVLPAATAEVMLDVDSLSYLAPLARMIAAPAAQLPALLTAYRTGGGVSWDQLGPDARESQGAMNRPWFLHALPDALRGSGDLDEILRRPGLRILDLGCGVGWSSIALATAYPEAVVVGVDVDAPSIELARAHAAAQGIGADRLGFRLGEVGQPGSEELYDVAFAFECVHDMARPVEVLAAVRSVLRPGAPFVIMDEAVADEFTAPGDEIEQLMYGFSALICLPDGMSSQPSAGTGTVMRAPVLRGYAAQAGFGAVDVLPISDFGFFRFYSLS